MNPAEIDKYLYIRKTPTWLIKGIYSIGILTWIYFLYGYICFFNVNPLFFVILLPVISFLFIYHILSYTIMMCYKNFNLEKHRKLISFVNFQRFSKTKRNYPLIDVFIPICGEETEVIENTLKAVARLNYPNIKVYVLDDRGQKEHRALTKRFNFKYFSRKNKGEMKKAGNIKYGFEKSRGDFIIIFDADFAPHPDFIKELLPYMADEKVAIIQTPQYFQTNKEVHNSSQIQYGASHVQEDFYRFIQVARSRLGAPICCGSNAVYRRSALEEIGGIVLIEHSEDAYTGFQLINMGYKVLYIPIILAVGLCPNNLHSYFHQQHRWCSGSLLMMLDKNFWKSNLTYIQKLCFMSGFFYYLSHLITVIISFQVFIVLFLYKDTINLYNTLPFIPCIVFSLIVLPQIRITKMRFGGFLARNAYVYAYVHSTIVTLLKKSVGWEPTNTKRLDVSKEYLQQTLFIAVYFIIYVSLCSISLGLGTIDILNVNSYSLLFWIIYNLISTSIILIYLYLLIDNIKKLKIDSKASQINFIFWRFKTAWSYTFLLLLCSSVSFFLGKYLLEHNNLEPHSPNAYQNILADTI